MQSFIPMLVSFGIAFITIPFWRKAALAWGFVDQPGARKIHVVPIPLLGGIAIYLGCVITIVSFDGWSNRSITMAIGGGLLVIVGLVDDWYKSQKKNFAVWPRVVAYGVAAGIPPLLGIQITGMTSWFQPENPGMIFFDPWFSWLVTMLWIFSLINMVNFIDGVDGLASGIVAIASITLFIIAMMKGTMGPGLLAASIAGACIAFWVYNVYPAKMFMGDAGATFLGFGLAVVTIDGAFKSAAVVSLLPPIIALGVPLLDTGIVMTRRMLQGSGLHRADKLHTHHTLMKWGLSQAQTVSFLYLIGVIFSLLSIVAVLVIE
jgi:UDP-GlcNAc:undecaprenyl-phosphate GlcNAc-1-phosphate transferase